MAGNTDVSFGNVIGSNIFNVLLILGSCAVILPLSVGQKLIRMDVPVMIGVSAAVVVMALDGAVSRIEGGVLVAGLIGYTLWTITSARRGHAPAPAGAPEGPSQRGGSRFVLQALWILVSLGGLVFGSRLFVQGAVEMAQRLGVSDLVVGLTIVAAGTSLPEVATSIVATIRGERDIAVGNVVGSNAFNILGVLGLSALIGQGGRISVSPESLSFGVTPAAVRGVPEKTLRATASAESR